MLNIFIQIIFMFINILLGFRAPCLIFLVSWMLFVPQFFCAEVTCTPPDYPEGGSYKPKKAEYEEGQSIRYSCKDRLLKWDRYGPVTCESTGKWSEKTPFCDSPTKLKSAIASSRAGDTKESAILDGTHLTCFQTENGTDESLTIFLDRPALIYTVRMYFPTGSKGIFSIHVSPATDSPITDREFCDSYNADTGVYNWYQLFCKETDMKAESITIQVSPGTTGSISICEIQIYVKDDEWCEEPPKNLVVNSQLEVSRSTAILSCNEIVSEKANRSVYAACKNNRWSYNELHCTENICDPVIGNISPSEGEWHSYGKALSAGAKRTLKCKDGYYIEGEPKTVICNKNGTWTKTTATCKKEKPPPNYKVIGIAVGCVVVVIKLLVLGLTIFLKRRKKAKEIVVIHKALEDTNIKFPACDDEKGTTEQTEKNQTKHNDVEIPPAKA